MDFNFFHILNYVMKWIRSKSKEQNQKIPETCEARSIIHSALGGYQSSLTQLLPGISIMFNSIHCRSWINTKLGLSQYAEFLPNKVTEFFSLSNEFIFFCISNKRKIYLIFGLNLTRWDAKKWCNVFLSPLNCSFLFWRQFGWHELYLPYPFLLFDTRFVPFGADS